MKFAHMADVHIGSWRDPKMKDLSSEAFKKAIDSCIEESVDFILIAGDLFNTALPGIDHVKDVFRALKKAKDKNIRVYFIPGSHDFSPSGKTMLDVIEEAGLGINVMKQKDGFLTLTKDVSNTYITGITGLKGMLDKKHYHNLKIKKPDDSSFNDAFKIFMFHTSLEELKPKDMSAMESIAVSLLPKNFDYYAGGHVHIIEHKNFENHGLKNVVYPGPLFPANFSEMEKLGNGTFFIYNEGAIEQKKVVVKESISVNIEINDKKLEEAVKIINSRLSELDVKDKIVLIRVQGSLQDGKPSDMPFKDFFNELYNKGAYFVMKSTTKLLIKDFLEEEMPEMTGDEIEEQIILEHINQIPNNFKDELYTTKILLKVFSEEKNEAETNNDYLERINKEAEKLLFNKE